MTREAVVQRVEVVDDDTGHGRDVVFDPGGGDNGTASHYACAGDDAQPLPGDFVALTEASGQGGEAAAGYADVRNAGKARAGEKRIYARKPDGSVACDVWLKGDETIAISFGAGGSFECKANGDVVINGVVISKSGAVSAPGEVTAKSLGPIPIKLSAHTHLTAGTGPAVGPSPLPPTP